MVGIGTKICDAIDKFGWEYDHAVCWTKDEPNHDLIVRNAIQRYNLIGKMIEGMYLSDLIGERLYSRVTYHYYMTRETFNIPEYPIL